MKLGFVGAGNMAGALISGVVNGSVLPACDVHVFDVNQKHAQAMQEKLGVTAHETCEAMIDASDVVVVAIKPYVVSKVLSQQRTRLRGKAVISIAAGWTSEMLAQALDASTRYLRVMPNTPALVLNGMTALSLLTTLTQAENAFAEQMFGALGRMCWVNEDQMEAVTGVSGCGPAYAYLFIEALADAGVYLGLGRALSIEMAAQTLKGAAEMVLQTGRHPGDLKDMVCSPGGATIVGVKALEDHGFRAAVFDAAVKSADKEKKKKNA